MPTVRVNARRRVLADAAGVACLVYVPPLPTRALSTSILNHFSFHKPPLLTPFFFFLFFLFYLLSSIFLFFLYSSFSSICPLASSLLTCTTRFVTTRSHTAPALAKTHHRPANTLLSFCGRSSGCDARGPGTQCMPWKYWWGRRAVRFV